MEIIQGKGVSGDLVRGKLCIFRHIHDIHDSSHTFTDSKTEKQRFKEACRTVYTELDSLQKQAVEKAGKNESEIFTIHRMMLEDEEFIDGVYTRIDAGETAESAAEHTGEALAAIFLNMDNSYMQARAADIRSVAGRLADVLNGGERTAFQLTEPGIIAADDLTPAETVTLDKNNVLGFVTEYGSENAHTAILARTMNIPAVVSVGRLDDKYNGAECILNGREGILYINPDEETCRRYEASCQEIQRKREYFDTFRGVRCKLPEGKSIQICGNAGGIEDVIEARENDAEGIGLFRSEFLFMHYGRCPTEEEQLAVYKEAVRHMGGRETIIRTLDAGADKQLEWLTGEYNEKNPALGLRAVRLCLRHSSLLYTQLRALYRAAAYGPVAAMIPLITVPEEIKQVREIAAQAVSSLRMEKIEHNPQMSIGIMIETPSAALYAKELADMADFFSIGTNDLIQYTLAADRENPEVAYLMKPLPKSVLRLMEMTAAAGQKAGIPVGVCGELGGDPSLTAFFLKIGITKLSVSPAHILRVRSEVIKALEEEKQN